jgi:hypothetical protein
LLRVARPLALRTTTRRDLMSTAAITPADLIRRYFELDAERDIDSIVDLFTEDATVVDEGEMRHGTTEIRAWQIGPASKYTYTTEVLDTDALKADRHVVTGRLTGNFPGGTAELKWDFTVTGGRISRLVIAPRIPRRRSSRRASPGSARSSAAAREG